MSVNVEQLFIRPSTSTQEIASWQTSLPEIVPTGSFETWKTTSPNHNSTVELPLPSQEKSPNDMNLSESIDFLDTNWKSQGLSHDWYNLGNRVGFSMKTQMELLPSLDEQSVGVWIDRTKQDIIGFDLEYLQSDIITYPYFYKRSEDGSQLINFRYGKDIIQTASRSERNGSVVETLEHMKNYFLNPETPDGSLAVMVSPLGPTGLRTDNNKAIIYPDSYVFIFKKNGVNVEGFTLQTDFTKKECREVLYRLTGARLANDAPVEEYIRSMAFLPPPMNQAGINSTDDLLHLLQHVRTTPYAYKQVTWDKVKRDSTKLDQLIARDAEVDSALEEWKRFMLEKQYRSREEEMSDKSIRRIIQKALAATVLRISRVSLEKEITRFTAMENYVMALHHHGPVAVYTRQIPETALTYGDVQHWVEQQPGCAGGGGEQSVLDKGLHTLIDSIVKRFGTTAESTDYKNDSNLCTCGGKEPHFHCPGKNGACNHPIIVGYGTTKCPMCGQGKTC